MIAFLKARDHPLGQASRLLWLSCLAALGQTSGACPCWLSTLVALTLISLVRMSPISATLALDCGLQTLCFLCLAAAVRRMRNEMADPDFKHPTGDLFKGTPVFIPAICTEHQQVVAFFVLGGSSFN